MTPERHPLDALHDLVAGRLDASERLRVEQHIAECSSCRAELDRLRFTRDLMRRFAEADEVPPDLEARIAATLDREAGRTGRKRMGFAFAALAAVAAFVYFVVSYPRAELPTAAADDYGAVIANALPLEVRTSETARLEQWFDARLPFRTRVFDFGMMRYELVGGRIDALGRRKSALFVYRGERGDRIVCEMFEGRTSDLPPGADTRVHNGITFHIYDRDGRTVVFWQEGAVVCVLVGEGSPDDVIALAFAKAMKV